MLHEQLRRPLPQVRGPRRLVPDDGLPVEAGGEVPVLALALVGMGILPSSVGVGAGAGAGDLPVFVPVLGRELVRLQLLQGGPNLGNVATASAAAVAVAAHRWCGTINT